MARELIVRMTDDLDRSQPADEVIEIGWEGYVYMVDLTTAHAKEFRETLAPYLHAAHEKVKWPKANRPKPSDAPPSPTIKVDKATGREIRDWARKNGYEVKDRGYLPGKIIQAFADAQRG